VKQNKTFQAYVKAARETADPEAYDLEYLIPGIVGEIGEIFGQRAKAHWHGWPTEQLRTELTSELGDVAWMTAILLDRFGVTEIPREEYDKMDRSYTNAIPVSSLLLARAESLHNAHMSSLDLDEIAERLIPATAASLWALIETRSPQITEGAKFGEVLDYNLKKLADRAARKVLKGSGDHR
jgi:NTP pyrophosphatase (non-canonical NTP hydrolase)